jgi:N-acetylmuramoyl-L-alanine amidase
MRRSMDDPALLIVVAALLLGSCSGTDPQQPRRLEEHLANVMMPGWQPVALDEALAKLDARGVWQDHGRPLSVPRHPAEKYLSGMIIVLDPGHGGRADAKGYKRGPTGVREAEMNLRVAKLLRRLLEDAGVTVTLTREGEVSEAADDRLEDTHFRRAEIANKHPRPGGGFGADLLISLHHNASSRPEANYPSVWFHGEADWSEPALDVARYIGHRLGAELRAHEVGLTSVLMSDQQMYKRGFAVLRHAKVPAILTESSFFTEPHEEQRLRDAAYNLREAYAIYLGLVEYAYGGRPTQSAPKLSLDGGELVIRTTLSEGLPEWWGHERQRILSSTIAVYLEGERILARYDAKSKQLEARVPVPDPLPALPLELRIHHANIYKHHNWPQRYQISLSQDGVRLDEPRLDRVLPNQSAGG